MGDAVIVGKGGTNSHPFVHTPVRMTGVLKVAILELLAAFGPVCAGGKGQEYVKKLNLDLLSTV
jgi:hypothetical protein